MSIQLELAAFPITIWEANPIEFVNRTIPIDSSFSIGAIVFLIDFILLQKLNMVTKNAVTIFSFNLGEFSSTIQAVIDRSYNFYLMKYEAKIQVTGSPFLQSSQIEVDQLDYDQTGQQKVTIIFRLKQTFKTSLNQISLNFGTDINNVKFGKFSVQKMTLKIKSRQQIMGDHLIRISQNNLLQNYDFQDGSFPIKYLIQKQNQINLGQKYFLQLIQNLPQYRAIDTSHKKNQLYVCHDMKGGYKQENEYGNPFLKNRQNSYRYNYFHHTSIFNYFSHHTISIPPKHWRQLCKKYQVKCLGTFIVQAGRINQKYYLTEQFAYKLIYIAKKLKFDGYLLNIQDRVVDTKQLNKWLKLLTEKIHIQIPGSFIVWYDSIVTQGYIAYQNQVNSMNQIYYNITDHFFTNYWWNQRQIQDDIKQLRLGTQKTIFVGNDVYGRGTYGGGQYDLYKAIDLLSSQKKQNIGICLFGQAFDYENGGRDNNPMFKVNQNRLYRGVQSQIISLNQWTEKMQDSSNQKLFFKSTIIDLYSKKKRNPLEQVVVQIKFVYKGKVLSNQMNVQNKYKVYIQIYNTQSNEIIRENQKLTKNLHLKSLKFSQTLQERISINNNLIGPHMSLKILIISNNNQTLSFQKEKLVISYYNEKKDWINKLSITSYKLNQIINTFFNHGQGSHFYCQGNKVFSKYDYMTDYDILHTHSINHPFLSQILFNDSYIGGSSLQIKSNKLLLLKINFAFQQQNSEQIKYYYIKIVAKDGEVSNLSIIQKTDKNNDEIINRQKFTKILQRPLQNQWKQLIYLITQKQINSLKLQTLAHKDVQVHSYLEGQFINQPIFGQLMIFPSQNQIQLIDQQKQKQDISQEYPQTLKNVSLTISLSFRTNSKLLTLSLDLQIDSYLQIRQNSKILNRYLIVINNDFSGFCYIEQRKCSLKQITVPTDQKETKSVIKVLDVDNSLKISTILQQKVYLKQLNEKSLNHRIQLKNY